MPLFRPSSKVVSATCQEIADIAGASADSQMTTRALRSLNAATKHFNGRAKWNFLLAEATPVTVFGPFTLAISASSQQASASALVGHGVLVDDFVVGSGITVGTRVSATGASGFGISPAFGTLVAGVQSFNVVVTRDFYDLPSDWKTPYSVRLLGAQKPLRPLTRRFYDRTIGNEFTVSSPDFYDVSQIGAKGKVRLLRAPSTADVLQLRYYRAMATASATGGNATALDIPSDYDDYLVSWAKWHFLVDKAEGRSEQAGVWLSLAQEGLKTMLSDQTAQPDEDLGFFPGHVAGSWSSDSTWSYLSDGD